MTWPAASRPRKCPQLPSDSARSTRLGDSIQASTWSSARGRGVGNRTLLVTGAVGTIGRELTRQLLEFGPAELRLLDNNESEVFFLHEEYEPVENVVVYLGSIRDRDKLESMCRGVNIVFHVAAISPLRSR